MPIQVLLRAVHKEIYKNCRDICTMVSFRGQFKLESHQHWCPLGVSSEFSGEHPRHFYFRPPSRALNTTEGPFIILEDFESSPFTVPLKKVRGKVDSELKILQKRSKYHFRGKGRQCIIGKAIQHLCSIDPYISLRINNWF